MVSVLYLFKSYYKVQSDPYLYNYLLINLLPVMEKAGYSQIPKNVEEVVVSYKLLKVGDIPEMNRQQINTCTEQRFQLFYRIFQQYRGSKQQAQQAWAKEFSDTYWYYVFFG